MAILISIGIAAVLGFVLYLIIPSEQQKEIKTQSEHSIGEKMNKLKSENPALYEELCDDLARNNMKI